MPQLNSRDAETVEETQGLLNSPTLNEEEVLEENATSVGTEEKPMSSNTIIIPTLNKTGISQASLPSKQSLLEASLNLCRICLVSDPCIPLCSRCFQIYRIDQCLKRITFRKRTPLEISILPAVVLGRNGGLIGPVFSDG
jgi:hypothetical protein